MFRLLIVAACLTLAACASGAKPEAMISAAAPGQELPQKSPLRDSMSVGAVTGGSETSPLWKSEVSSKDFAEALRQTLVARTMIATANARYVLAAELIELDQPLLGGFDMEVTSKVKYTLTRTKDSKTVFETTVTAPYTANFSSTFLGVERLRLANEGSMRENIRIMLDELIAASQNDPAFKNDRGLTSELMRLQRAG